MNNFKEFMVNYLVEKSALPDVDSFLLAEGFSQVLFDDRIKSRITCDYMKRKMNNDTRHITGRLHGAILNHGDKKYEFHEIGTNLSDGDKKHTIIKVVDKKTNKAVLHV